MTGGADRSRGGREIVSDLLNLSQRVSQTIDVDTMDPGALRADGNLVDATLLQLLSQIADATAVPETERSTAIRLREYAFEAAELEKEWRLFRRRSSEHEREEMNSSLSRLREISSLDMLFGALCREVCRGCGSDRALLARVSEVGWIPWHEFTTRGTHYRRTTNTDSDALLLRDLPRELAIVEGGHPVVTVDSHYAQEPEPVRRLMREDGFTIASLTAGGRVFGLIYAAHPLANHRSDRPIAIRLQTFAAAVGHLANRLEMFGRVRAQHRFARESLAAAELLTDSFNSDVDLTQLVGREHAGPAGPGGGSWPTARPTLDQILTSRERDVMALLVRGHDTNAIAEELTITSSTVKSHLQNILRKAGAVNKSELIARYYDVSLNP